MIEVTLSEESISAAIRGILNEYNRASIQRAIKREYEVHRVDSKIPDDAIVFDSIMGRIQVHAIETGRYAAYGKEEVIIVARKLDNVDCGRSKGLYIPAFEYRFFVDELGVPHFCKMHTLGFGEPRKIEHDLKWYMIALWGAFASEHRELLLDMVAKHHNNIVDGKIAQLQEKIDALEETKMQRSDSVSTELSTTTL